MNQIVLRIAGTILAIVEQVVKRDRAVDTVDTEAAIVRLREELARYEALRKELDP